MGFERFDIKVPLNDTLYISISEGTNSQTITNNPQVPTRIDAMFVTSTAATDHLLEVGVYEGGRTHSFGRVNIPAGAGNGIVPIVEVVAALAPPSLGCFLITSSWVFYGLVPVALIGAEEIKAVCIDGTF